ncbi:hypothetical protein AHAS_Ahas11G0156200 [Arachis hypogaea]
MTSARKGEAETTRTGEAKTTLGRNGEAATPTHGEEWRSDDDDPRRGAEKRRRRPTVRSSDRETTKRATEREGREGFADDNDAGMWGMRWLRVGWQWVATVAVGG